MKEYEVKSAANIILKKQNSLDEEQIMQYLLKKGYKTSSIREALEQI